MIQYTITDDINIINVDNGAFVQEINKPYDVSIVDTTSGANTGILIKSAYEQAVIPYAQIISPLTADINAMVALLAGYNNTQNTGGGGGGGSATAANQVLEIAELTDINSNTAPSSSAAISSVASSITNVTLLASNAARKGATIYNTGSDILYAKLGATATLASYTVPIISQAYYEVPFGYTGIIDGIWDVATGSAVITELT